MAHFTLAAFLERPLAQSKISDLKEAYFAELQKHPFPDVKGSDHSKLLSALKRTNHQIGAYSEITIFEAANRIASDLTLLEGVQQLFKQGIISPIAMIQVRLGTMQAKGKGDFSVFEGTREYQGEAFDVNPSFFRSKLYTTLRKWRGNSEFRYVVFNLNVLIDGSCAFYLEDQKRKRAHENIIFIGVRSWHK